MSDIPSDDPFWEIIKYLNDNNLQGDSRIWNTSMGPMWIYWDRGRWNKRSIEVSEWPIA